MVGSSILNLILKYCLHDQIGCQSRFVTTRSRGEVFHELAGSWLADGNNWITVSHSVVTIVTGVVWFRTRIDDIIELDWDSHTHAHTRTGIWLTSLT